AQIQLFDPNGTSIALATSPQPGAPVVVGPVVSPAPGRYVIQITGPSNSTGSYRLRAFVQTAIEVESRDPAASNDFTAEDLNGAVTAQGGPGSTLRAVTVAGNIGQDAGGFGGIGDFTDTFSFTATAGQQVTVGLFRPAG